MRRRVSIARALIDRPPIALYDSPTAGLDPVTSQTIITLILSLRDLYGVTSLLATHRLQDGFALANFRFNPEVGRVVPLAANPGEERSENGGGTRFLVYREGKVYFEGDQHQILKSGDPYLNRFLICTLFAIREERMAQRKQLSWTELRVGLFVLVGLLVLAVGIFYVTGYGFLGAKYRLYAYLPEVSGLATGAPVRPDGVEVGKVEAIRIMPR